MDTCKGHAEKLLLSAYDDPKTGDEPAWMDFNDNLNLVDYEFWPYDNHDSIASVENGGAGVLDLNYKAVTHEGTCLHTCPNYYDDSDELI